MDRSCLDYCLTEEEKCAFERDGFFIVEDVLTTEKVDSVIRAVDRIDDLFRSRIVAGDENLDITPDRVDRQIGAVKEDVIVRPGRMTVHDRFELLNVFKYDNIFLELVDLPKVLPKVWGILGWNIKVYVTQMVTTPRVPEDDARKVIDGWHRDTGRLNIELETKPQPRISLKVGFFLTDSMSEDAGNFYVVRGSQLKDEITIPEDGTLPDDAIAVQIKAGSAVIFDRRIWHSSSRNFSETTRKVLFYGYSYRWLQPRDNMTVEHLMEQSGPIRRQLLGASPNGGFGYTSPKDEDVPLKVWLQENLDEDAVLP